MKVYLAYSPGLGLIKIGCSANLKKRINHLSTECGHSARLLFVVRGGYERERALHKRFAAHAVGNEWFKPEGKLAAFLERNGHGELHGPASAKVIGQMKRRYTMRLKRARIAYRQWAEARA